MPRAVYIHVMENQPPKEIRARKTAAPAAKPAVDPYAEVLNKYTANGWTVITPPKGALNDLITQKGKKLHFVQIITKETVTGARYQGIAKNTFIQNAFANAAIPVYALVTASGNRISVSFEDVNQNSKLIITAKTPKQPVAVIATQAPDADT